MLFIEPSDIMSLSSSSTLVSTDDWLNAASHRRTIYGLKGTSSVSDDRVEEIIRKVQSFAPSAYNSQPIRYTLVTGAKHQQFWDAVSRAAEPHLKGISEQVWEGMQGFLQSHKAAYGSVRIHYSFNLKYGEVDFL